MGQTSRRTMSATLSTPVAYCTGRCIVNKRGRMEKMPMARLECHGHNKKTAEQQSRIPLFLLMHVNNKSNRILFEFATGPLLAHVRTSTPATVVVNKNSLFLCPVTRNGCDPVTVDPK
eukprot:6838978-Ditylum_brightwellii.AAC.1